jgi:hypothetical protein
MSQFFPGELRLCFDRAVGRCACRIALSAVMLATLVACHTASTRVTAPDRAPPPVTHPLDEGPYDWHGLLIAPFGSVLKDIPVALHEVLLFRDEAHGSAAADEAAADAECYAAPAPRFVGRTPNEYLLCFKQDRLSRVQASLRLTTAEASDVFAAACASWLRNAAPATTSAGAPSVGAPNVGAPSTGTPNAEPPSAGASATEAQSVAAPIGAACEGRDGPIHFSGRLSEESGQAEMPPAETLSVILDSVPNP